MDTLAARQQMVDQQIRTWEVLDPRVLDALSAVPREAFTPAKYRELAFADAPLPIGCGAPDSMTCVSIRLNAGRGSKFRSRSSGIRCPG